MRIDVEVLESGTGGREPSKDDRERHNRTEELQCHSLPPAPSSGRKVSGRLKGCPEFKIKRRGYESNEEMQLRYKEVIYGGGSSNGVFESS
jgi:hypothetical protein